VSVAGWATHARINEPANEPATSKETHLVLTLTENASTVVKTIVGQSVDPAAAQDTAGLRISQDAPDSPALHVMATEAPEPGDQVLEEDGARVFLEETAAVTLDDKVLDAQVDEGGGVQFSIGAQQG
jgi:iron-sulfur cluster assembly protein